MIKTLDWVVEDLLPEEIEENKPGDAEVTEDELSALLNGKSCYIRLLAVR